MGERPGGLSNALDMGSTSDHVVALTQLREQISSLQRQLQQKDQQLLAKDRQVRLIRRSMIILGLNSLPYILKQRRAINSKATENFEL